MTSENPDKQRPGESRGVYWQRISQEARESKTSDQTSPDGQKSGETRAERAQRKFLVQQAPQEEQQPRRISKGEKYRQMSASHQAGRPNLASLLSGFNELDPDGQGFVMTLANQGIDTGNDEHIKMLVELMPKISDDQVQIEVPLSSGRVVTYTSREAFLNDYPNGITPPTAKKGLVDRLIENIQRKPNTSQLPGLREKKRK